MFKKRSFKIIKQELFHSIEDYNFIQISSELDLKEDSNFINLNIQKSSIIMVNHFQEDVNHEQKVFFILGIDKAIIKIEQSFLISLQPLFNSDNIQVYFLSEEKEYFDLKNITIVEFDSDFKKDIVGFNEYLKIKNKKEINPNLFNLWVKILPCISSYLIWKSYSKLNQDRFNDYVKNFDEISYLLPEQYDSHIPLRQVSNKDYIELRNINQGSQFNAVLIFYIPNEELYIIKKPYGSVDVRSIENEFHQLKKICDHPFIPKLYGKTTENYIITEYIKGKTLNEVKNLTLHEKYIIIYEIMHILGHLELKHLIYRDLKPTNIIIDNRKNAVLIDYDLAIDKCEIQRKKLVNIKKNVLLI